MSEGAIIPMPQTKSVLVDMANRFGMEPQAFEATVRAICMPPGTTREEFAAFLLVCKEYRLNPLTRECYAMKKRQGDGIQPIVGVDGWGRMMNDHHAFDGLDFEELFENGEFAAVRCRIYRKDRSHPIVVTEYLHECLQYDRHGKLVPNWEKYPRRMLRHKAMIQAARICFSFSGIVDPDEADRFTIAHEPQRVIPPPPPPAPTGTAQAVAAGLRDAGDTMQMAAPIQEDATANLVKAIKAQRPDVEVEYKEIVKTDIPLPEGVDAETGEFFDGDASLDWLKQQLAECKTLDEVDAICASFEVDMEQLTRSQRETAHHIVQGAHKRLTAPEVTSGTSKREMLESLREDKPASEVQEQEEKRKDDGKDRQAYLAKAGPEACETPDDYARWLNHVMQTSPYYNALWKAWLNTDAIRDRLQIPAARRLTMKKAVQAQKDRFNAQEG